MENTSDYKVDFMRGQLHKELENCTSLTDARVVVLSQLLDEFVVERQKQLISKNYQKAIAI
ncbi:MAG: Spo0E family sporulation regulatory protein-aspartic acid phosphatase, partial [Clostridium sp.]